MDYFVVAANVALARQVDAAVERLVRYVEHHVAPFQRRLAAGGQGAPGRRQWQQLQVHVRHFAHLVQAGQPFVGACLVDVLLEQEDLGRGLARCNVFQRVAKQAVDRDIDDERRHRNGEQHQDEEAEK